MKKLFTITFDSNDDEEEEEEDKNEKRTKEEHLKSVKQKNQLILPTAPKACINRHYKSNKSSSTHVSPSSNQILPTNTHAIRQRPNIKCSMPSNSNTTEHVIQHLKSTPQIAETHNTNIIEKNAPKNNLTVVLGDSDSDLDSDSNHFQQIYDVGDQVSPSERRDLTIDNTNDDYHDESDTFESDCDSNHDININININVNTSNSMNPNITYTPAKQSEAFVGKTLNQNVYNHSQQNFDYSRSLSIESRRSSLDMKRLSSQPKVVSVYRCRRSVRVIWGKRTKFELFNKGNVSLIGKGKGFNMEELFIYSNSSNIDKSTSIQIKDEGATFSLIEKSIEIAEIRFSMPNVSFPRELLLKIFPRNENSTWTVPKVLKNVKPKYNSLKKSWQLNLYGKFALKSCKNCVLENEQSRKIVIVRKTAKNDIDIEVTKEIDPKIIFFIGISSFLCSI